MSRLERPVLKLKFELEVPNLDGALPKKFAISRALKARWNENPGVVTQQILNEIKDYKGSYIGDSIHSLHSLVNSNQNLTDEEILRSNDLAKWIAQILDSILFFGVDDQDCISLLNNETIPDCDGSLKEIGPINENEIKEVDLEKVMTLLEPRIKYILLLLSKKMKENKESI